MVVRIFSVSLAMVSIAVSINGALLLLFLISLTPLSPIRMKQLSNPIFVRLIAFQLIVNLLHEGMTFDNMLYGGMSVATSCDITIRISSSFYILCRANVFYFLIRRAHVVDVGHTPFISGVYKVTYVLIVVYVAVLEGLAKFLYSSSAIYIPEYGQEFCMFTFSIFVAGFDEMIDLVLELLCLYLTQTPLKHLSDITSNHVVSNDQHTTVPTQITQLTGTTGSELNRSLGKTGTMTTGSNGLTSIDVDDKKRIQKITNVIRGNYKCAWISLLINACTTMIAGIIELFVPDSFQGGQSKSLTFGLASLGNALHVIWMIYLARKSWDFSVIRIWWYGDENRIASAQSAGNGSKAENL